MQAQALLKQIADDIADIKKRIVKIEIGVDELDNDVHELRPEYSKKLKMIEKSKHNKFNSINELKQLVENV